MTKYVFVRKTMNVTPQTIHYTERGAYSRDKYLVQKIIVSHS